MFFGGEVMNKISNIFRRLLLSILIISMLSLTASNFNYSTMGDLLLLNNVEEDKDEVVIISDNEVYIETNLDDGETGESLGIEEGFQVSYPDLVSQIIEDKTLIEDNSQLVESQINNSNYLASGGEINQEVQVNEEEAKIVEAIMEDEELEKKILDYLEGKKGEFSFYIIDPVTGERTMINNRTLSAASIIKVFLIVEVHKQVRDGKISFDDLLTLKDDYKVFGSGILVKKPPGTKYKVSYLLHLVITISDNVAANMLADYVGLQNINKTAKELGMEDTNFGHLILTADKMKYYYGRNVTNAKDLATMMYKIYSYECLGEEYDKMMIELFKTCKTNSKIPRGVPEGTVVAHKTGSLPLYEHDAGIVFNESRDFIFAATSNELKSNRDGQIIIATVARITYDHMLEKQRKAEEAKIEKIQKEQLRPFNHYKGLYFITYRMFEL